ncbi:Protein sel-1 1 [Neolecta irregularis DAH-3]|uniref:Protein sel-1 1 n=1 Tax=Neolecta irregularis (strain DAH-3) TaxID=1198029 RepID=A0A1U7LWY1_NEOID|nr:Protein sel-1 1 [Neolecta irregularis DAH-3]|eukprot:OLL27144.1 Protein sel-1 1 [Neolecta irregularis DAH-3]
MRLYYGILSLFGILRGVSAQEESNSPHVFDPTLQQYVPELQHSSSEEYLSQIKDAIYFEDARDEETMALVDSALLSLKSNSKRNNRQESRSSSPSVIPTLLRSLVSVLFSQLRSLEDSSSSSNSHAMNNALELLKKAAIRGNSDAMWLLGEFNFHGNYSIIPNYPEAIKWYTESAIKTGNPSAQAMLGFLYATGYGDANARDQGMAHLYYTFAALSGDVRYEMTLGYRHFNGIGTPKSCEDAVVYYKKAADSAIKWWQTGPPGGQYLARHDYSLPEDDGGIYGDGASSTISIHHKKSQPTDASKELDDVLEYLRFMAEKGDITSQFGLGRLYYDGSRATNRNFQKSLFYFQGVARQYWTSSGAMVPNPLPGTALAAAKSAGYIGRMYLRGEGVAQNFEKAAQWFQRGIDLGDSVSQNGIGYMFLNGLGLKKDIKRGYEYFKAAADQDFAPAQMNLGKVYLERKEVNVALKLFESSARHGNIEALYHLAELSNSGKARERDCNLATLYYKTVAERIECGRSTIPDANAAIEAGDLDRAIIGYLIAAEQGYEVAQTNVAYLLDQDKHRLSLSFLQKPPNGTNEELALIYYSRSSTQGNIDAIVKVGDFYFKGIGTAPDYAKAANCYASASDTKLSPMAYWNLGWMYENGYGMKQDYNLAKRYYDHAIQISPNSWLPVQLALLKLRVRSAWNTLTGAPINSIGDDENPPPQITVKSAIQQLFKRYQQPALGQNKGKAQASTKMPENVLDDYQQDVLEDDYLEDFEDSILETLAILGLCGFVAFLLWWRQNQQLREGQQQNHRPQNNEGRDEPGLPIPPPLL